MAVASLFPALLMSVDRLMFSEGAMVVLLALRVTTSSGAVTGAIGAVTTTSEASEQLLSLYCSHL